MAAAGPDGGQTHRPSLRFSSPASHDLQICALSEDQASRRGSEHRQRFNVHDRACQCVKPARKALRVRSGEFTARVSCNRWEPGPRLIGSFRCSAANARRFLGHKRLLYQSLGLVFQGDEHCRPPPVVSECSGGLRAIGRIVCGVLSGSGHQWRWARCWNTHGARSRRRGIGHENTEPDPPSGIEADTATPVPSMKLRGTVDCTSIYRCL